MLIPKESGSWVRRVTIYLTTSDASHFLEMGRTLHPTLGHQSSARLMHLYKQ